MKKILLSASILLLTINMYAQKQITLTIAHKLGANSFAFNQASQNDLTQDFKITRVDYYISKITLIHDGGITTNVPNKYILAKGSANVIEDLGTWNVTNIEGIKFYIGVDSPTNNSDPTLYQAPNPLAPQLPSMQWGWSAGYRFVAIEGMAGPTYNTNFQMHGLGNANYFQQTIMLSGVNAGNAVTINLDADYNQALKGININAGPIDHGVDATDLTVLQNFRDYVFKPGAGIPNALNDVVKESEIQMYPNPSTGNVHVNILSKNAKINYVEVIDITGKTVKQFAVTNVSNFDFSMQIKGMYFVKMFDGNQQMATRKLVIQ